MPDHRKDSQWCSSASLTDSAAPPVRESGVRRQRSVLTPGPLQLAPEELVERAAVGQAGESVLGAQSADLLVVLGFDVSTGQVPEDAVPDPQVVTVSEPARVVHRLVVDSGAVGAAQVADEV